MKCIKIILLLISVVQICFGQDEGIAYEKQITTIEFYINTSDTTIQNIKFDTQGKRIEEPSQYISISSPIKIDTIQVSEKERRIEYTWENDSITVTKEFKTPKKEITVCIDQSGIDTTYYYSEFNFNDDGFPVSGITTNYGETAKYEIFNNIPMSEILEIQSNIVSESEFIDFSGIIQILSKRKVLITELEDRRNTIEILLNDKLKPEKVIKREWHKDHKMIFENKYSYKYKEGRLVEIKNVDMNGETEMIRKIVYKSY